MAMSASAVSRRPSTTQHAMAPHTPDGGVVKVKLPSILESVGSRKRTDSLLSPMLPASSSPRQPHSSASFASMYLPPPTPSPPTVSLSVESLDLPDGARSRRASVSMIPTVGSLLTPRSPSPGSCRRQSCSEGSLGIVSSSIIAFAEVDEDLRSSRRLGRSRTTSPPTGRPRSTSPQPQRSYSDIGASYLDVINNGLENIRKSREREAARLEKVYNPSTGSGTFNVETHEYYRIMKDVQALENHIEAAQKNLAIKTDELNAAIAANNEYEAQARRTEEDVMASRAELETINVRKARLEVLEVQQKTEAEFADSIFAERAQLELALDNLQANVMTMKGVQGAFHARLRLASMQKDENILETIRIRQTVEASMVTLASQVEELMWETATKRQDLDAVLLSIEEQQRHNQRQHHRIEQAQERIHQLIREIGSYDAKIAMQHKADKRAKEAARLAKVYPTGIVTIVFADVEGSTSQWESYPKTMGAALDVMDIVCREYIPQYNGYEVKTCGDSIMVAFQSPLDAVNWCMSIQLGLVQAKWPAGILQSPNAAEVVDETGNVIFNGLRLRMGVHLGRPECKVDSTIGRADYFGSMVNRCARICAAAVGGQTLLSRKVWDACRSQVKDVVAEELGAHFLKGLNSPEELTSVLPASLSARKFAPLKTNSNQPKELEEPLKFEEYTEDEWDDEQEIENKSSTLLAELEGIERAKAQRQRLKDLENTVKLLETKIADHEEKHTKHMHDLKVESNLQANYERDISLYEQDIVQARTEKEIMKEILLEALKNPVDVRHATLGASAKVYCLLMREELMLSQQKRLQQEIDLLNAYWAELGGGSNASLAQQTRYYEDRLRLMQSQKSELQAEAQRHIRQVESMEKNLRKMYEERQQLLKLVPVAGETATDSTKLQLDYDRLQGRLQNEALSKDMILNKVKFLQGAVESAQQQTSGQESREQLVKRIKILESELLELKGRKQNYRKVTGVLKELYAERLADQEKVSVFCLLCSVFLRGMMSVQWLQAAHSESS
eukprot:TRINITY_DN9659_c0_g1_i1.p1 TRINITY_DN9659_c0_g1~~TRINITY_DN9659_c0_g1_i1.p1  ORF type:complete len:1018 (+),score=399.92 TRINITY_DN9659_c0_g1_i1:203-3256(+)